MTTRLSPTRDWTARALTVSGLAALVLAGCGANDGGDPDASNTPDDLSPLEEYVGEGVLGFSGGGGMAVSVVAGGGGSSEEQKKQEREVQDLIAACMQDEGFEYVPYVPDEDTGGEFEDAFALPDDEFAEKYGYGISTLMPVGPADDESDSDDPNEAIANALTADARAAYDKALWGANGGAGGTVMMTEEDAEGGGPAVNGPPTIAPEDKGCWMTAADEVYGALEEGGDDGFTEFQGLFDDIGALQERIDSDPRLTEAKSAWADCMADAGFPGLSEPGDGETEVSERMQALWGDQEEGGGPREMDPSNVDPEALAELKEFELDIAPADYECQQEHKELYEEVRDELETEFVEAHKSELEAYREWSASNESMRIGVG